MRIVITGGGTGGHLFPAIALAEELKRRDEACEIIFIGGRGGVEERVLPGKGYRLELLDVDIVKGKSGLGKLKSFLKASGSTLKAINLLRKIKPVGVLGSGSYSSGPVVVAARLLGIKTAILEQNVLPGMTNRLLGRFAERIYVAFEESDAYFPENSVRFFGNPIRSEIMRGFKRGGRERSLHKRKEFTILVFGGSQGAKAINTAVLDALEYLTDILDSLRIIHQSGLEGYGDVKSAYERKGLLTDEEDLRGKRRVEIFKFIDDMSYAYSSADLVICRAGATTIAEITALGMAAILIPYPFAADNHQEVNARFLSKKGAAIMLKQEDLTGKVLADEIRRLYSNPDKLNAIDIASKALGRPEALNDIAEDYMNLLSADAGVNV